MAFDRAFSGPDGTLRFGITGEICMTYGAPRVVRVCSDVLVHMLARRATRWITTYSTSMVVTPRCMVGC